MILPRWEPAAASLDLGDTEVYEFYNMLTSDLLFL